MSNNNDKKISQLPEADALSGTELIPLVQGGATKTTTAADIANLAGGGGGGVASVNGDTGPAVVLGGEDITSSHTATNYTAEDSSIDGHLAGIDTALLSTGTSGFSHSLYVDPINGNDTTGDGSLTNPYATISKAVEEVPIVNDKSLSYSIELSPGLHITSALDLKPFLHVRGAGKDVTFVQVAPSNEVTIDTSSGFDILGEILVGLSNLTLISSSRLNFNTQPLPSGGYVTCLLKNIAITGPSIWVGRPNGVDNIKVKDCDILSGLDLTTVQVISDESGIASLALICSGYSGGGDIFSYIKGSRIPSIQLTSPDASKTQKLVIVASTINSLNANANSTAMEVFADAVSYPASITLSNGAALVKSTTPDKIDGLDIIDGLQDQLDSKADISDITGTNNKLAQFDGNTGLLTSADAQISQYGFIEQIKNIDTEEHDDPEYRNLGGRYVNVNFTEDVYKEFVTLDRQTLVIDSNESNFDFGDSSDPEITGGAGIISRYFQHRGAGNLGRLDINNTFVELGDETAQPAGTSGFVALRTDFLTVRPAYTVEEMIRMAHLGLDVRDGATIDSFNGFEQNYTIRTGGTVNSWFVGGSTNLSLEGTAAISSGVTQNRLSFQIAEDAAINAFTEGLNINIQNEGLVDSFTALNISLTGDGNYTNSPSGVNVNMGNYDTTAQRRVAFAGSNGGLNIGQEISTLPSMFFDQANVLFTAFRVKSGTPITSTSFISNNFSTGFLFEDDMDAGIFGIGAAGVGFVGQVAVASGKTASVINFGVGGGSIPNDGDIGGGFIGGGTIQRANIYSAIGIIDSGGDNNLIIEEICGFYMSEDTLGDKVWGVDIANPDAENHFAKSLVIGTANEVTNESIALELADKKALKLTPMTIAERDALTPSGFMIVAIEDSGDAELHFYNPITTSWSVITAV